MESRRRSRLVVTDQPCSRIPVWPTWAVMQHIRDVLLREPDSQVGHNPAGGWVVVLLLVLFLAETAATILVNLM